jgi:Cu/Ag efflux protein CusF
MVEPFAPVRQASPKGTSLPKTARPRAEGRLYVTLTSAKPIFCFTVAAGLGTGVLMTDCACDSRANESVKKDSDKAKKIRFMAKKLKI